jgi:predicted CXXCH cytochrome family protein
MKIIMVMLCCAAFAGTALADDVFDLPASKGKVSFPHKKHQEMLKDCIKCHEKGPGKIDELGKDWAHKVCKGCHAEMGKGPVSCAGCHQK